jgi:hypothetical protein
VQGPPFLVFLVVFYLSLAHGSGEGASERYGLQFSCTCDWSFDCASDSGCGFDWFMARIVMIVMGRGEGDGIRCTNGGKEGG